MSDTTHVYVGRLACGCMVAARSDTPGEPKRVAKDVAKFMRQGMTVDRMPLQAFRESTEPFGCTCPPAREGGGK
jgi:hypothetical protein